MENLLKRGYLCNTQQMVTLRRVTIAEGKAKGTAVIEVATPDGLQVDILPDAGLDLGGGDRDAQKAQDQQRRRDADVFVFHKGLPPNQFVAGSVCHLGKNMQIKIRRDRGRHGGRVIVTDLAGGSVCCAENWMLPFCG